MKGGRHQPRLQLTEVLCTYVLPGSILKDACVFMFWRMCVSVKQVVSAILSHVCGMLRTLIIYVFCLQQLCFWEEVMW